MLDFSRWHKKYELNVDGSLAVPVWRHLSRFMITLLHTTQGFLAQGAAWWPFFLRNALDVIRMTKNSTLKGITVLAFNIKNTVLTIPRQEAENVRMQITWCKALRPWQSHLSGWVCTFLCPPSQWHSHHRISLLPMRASNRPNIICTQVDYKRIPAHYPKQWAVYTPPLLPVFSQRKFHFPTRTWHNKAKSKDVPPCSIFLTDNIARYLRILLCSCHAALIWQGFQLLLMCNKLTLGWWSYKRVARCLVLHFIAVPSHRLSARFLPDCRFPSLASLWSHLWQCTPYHWEKKLAEC